MKIFITIIIVIILGAGVWYFWSKPKTVYLTRQSQSEYAQGQVEVVKDNKDYIVWDQPDRISEDSLYAYKLYPDNTCQLLYVFENEYPAGKKISKLRLCQDTIAKFYHLDDGWLVIQTAKCGIEYRKNILTGQQEITSDQGICQGSLINVQ